MRQLGYCSQAEAKDAATVQIAAQSPNEHEKITMPIACLVSAIAISRPDLSTRGRQWGVVKLLTE
jgi:hypothetical protein